MSASITLMIRADLSLDTPPWVIEYLKGLVDDPTTVPAPEVPSDHDFLSQFGSLPTGEWFTAPSALLRLHDHPRAWDLRLHGVFHESCLNWMYAFLALIARWTHDACIGTSWWDQGSGGATTYYAAAGELFGTQTELRPRPVSNEGGEFPLPTHSYPSPDPRELRAHGVPAERADVLGNRQNTDPALARWLLARRLWRAAVIEADYSELGPNPATDAVATRAVEQILRALDEGRDPLALDGAPGWQITEEPATRFRRWLRPISGLRDHFSDLSPTAVRQTPVRFEPGMRLRTLAPILLWATAAEMTPNTHSIGSTYHRLQVLVPVGEILTVVDVTKPGYASASNPRWPGWITDEQPGKHEDDPRAPRGPTDSYTVGRLDPLDASELWIALAEANE